MPQKSAEHDGVAESSPPVAGLDEFEMPRLLWLAVSTPIDSDNTQPLDSDESTMHEEEDDDSSSSSSSSEHYSNDDGDDNNGDDNELVSDYSSYGGSFYDTVPDVERFRQDLVQFVLKGIYQWISWAQYTIPPDHRARKQTRAINELHRSIYLENWSNEAPEDRNDGQFVILPRPNGYFHMACPYYVTNPQKYHECLQKHDLQYIEDVIDHLRRDHTEPPYCPICRTCFDAAINRDRHLIGRNCQRDDSRAIDGVNEHQKSKLVKRDDIDFTDEKRWKRIWEIVFPRISQRGSLYLDGERDQKVSKVRDYWEIFGRDLISRYFMTHTLPSPLQNNIDSTLTRFHTIILDDLLMTVLEGGMD